MINGLAIPRGAVGFIELGAQRINVRLRSRSSFCAVPGSLDPSAVDHGLYHCIYSRRSRNAGFFVADFRC